MAHNNRRAGEGEVFDEYFEDEHESIVKGDHNGVRYRIYRVPRGTQEGLMDSHYTGYICLSDITDDWESVFVDRLPHAPVHHGVNFGPTEDGWIGFGTLDGRDHNYTKDMEPLEADERISEEQAFGESTIFFFTPEILHSSILNWIREVSKDLDEWDVEEPDIKNYDSA